MPGRSAPRYLQPPRLAPAGQQCRIVGEDRAIGEGHAPRRAAAVPAAPAPKITIVLGLRPLAPVRTDR
jgi:hypothetical protein